MGLYNYVCPQCGPQKRLLTPVQAREAQMCRTCGKPITRAPQANPTVVVREILDNGFMTRRVERLADAERLTKERGQLGPDRGGGDTV